MAAWPKYKTMAIDLRIGRTRISRIIKGLADKGLVIKEKLSKNPLNHSTRYHLPFLTSDDADSPTWETVDSPTWETPESPTSGTTDQMDLFSNATEETAQKTDRNININNNNNINIKEEPKKAPNKKKDRPPNQFEIFEEKFSEIYKSNVGVDNVFNFNRDRKILKKLFIDHSFDFCIEVIPDYFKDAWGEKKGFDIPTFAYVFPGLKLRRVKGNADSPPSGFKV